MSGGLSCFPEKLGRGPEGRRGQSGAALPYVFDDATAAGPVSGQVRLNNADPEDATAIYVHETSALSADLSDILSDIKAGDRLSLIIREIPGALLAYQVLKVEDPGTYRTFTVRFIGSADAAYFVDAREIGLVYAKRGRTGGLSIPYSFDDATAAGGASGELRLNHATPASVTHIFANDTDRDGSAATAILLGLRAGELVRLFSDDVGGASAVYRITSISDESGYVDATVTHVSSTGSFVDGDLLSLAYSAQEIRLRKASVRKTDGDVDPPATTPAAVTGMEITFTLPVAGDALLTVSGVIDFNGGENNHTVVGYDLDGDGFLGILENLMGFGSDSDAVNLIPFSGQALIEGLDAGEHTVTLFVRSDTTGSLIKADTTYPLVMNLLYEA